MLYILFNTLVERFCLRRLLLFVGHHVVRYILNLYLLGRDAARQCRRLLVEKLLCALPYWSRRPVLEGQQAGQERVTESLGRFPWQCGGKVVDGDDG